MQSDDNLGLGRLGDFDLSAMLEPAQTRFQEIELVRIREDGENPRSTFDQNTLQEMAETIRARGVITPISVRLDPDREGAYIVNHGHRRLRAAKIAGLTEIPAVIDETFRDEDRIIENIQRDNLNMFEVAAFIERKVSEGLKQKDVAALIGKSTAYVSHHMQLLDLPPLVGQAVEEGRVNDLTSIADLAKIEKQNPEAVKHFLAGEDAVARTAVRDFRTGLDRAAPPKTTTPENDVKNDGTARIDSPDGEKNGKRADEERVAKREDGDQDLDDIYGASNATDELSTGGAQREKPDDQSGSRDAALLWRHGVVVVEMDGRRGVMRLERMPRNEKYVWVEWEDGDIAESEEALSGLSLKAVVSE